MRGEILPPTAMAVRDARERFGFILDSTFFLDAWGRRFHEEEGDALSFLAGAMFTTELIEQELARRPDWGHKHRVLASLKNLVRVIQPSEELLTKLARGQGTRRADWSLVALAEELTGGRDVYVVSNDTTIAADVARSSDAYGFLDDESFLRLVLSLADFRGVPWGRLVTIYSRVRDSMASRAADDQEWYQQLSALSARSEILINRILESWRSGFVARSLPEAAPPLGPVSLGAESPRGHLATVPPSEPTVQERLPQLSVRRPLGEIEKYNVTYSGNPSRGTERGIVMLGSPGSKRRDRLPSGWVHLRANGVDYWAKFVKIALNVVKENPTDSIQEPNLLDGILRSWFGKEGILPGEPVCHVAFRVAGVEEGSQVWEMRPF